MSDRTIFDEAAEALASHQWGDHPRAAHREHHFDSACKVCRGDIEAMAAVVLQVAEKRFRSFAEQYRKAEPTQTPLGAQWSATEQAIEWDAVADLIVKGLPAKTEADRA